MQLREKISKAIQDAKDNAKKLVGGPFLIAVQCLTRIVGAMPYNIFYKNVM
jgi:hypothetical protein